jgi:NADH-ubiquinone oxidoreductase chain 3
VSLVFLVGMFFLGKKVEFFKEKISPFECGFNPKFLFRHPFRIQFFLVALLFLIFDLELVLLFPYLLKEIYVVN